MALIPWVDAAYAPSPAEAAQAYSEGYRAVGFYLPGIPNSDPLNVWTPEQVNVCRQAGLRAVPIVVPDPNLAGDPTATADAAFNQATGPFGLATRQSILYTGNHLETTGQITGPIWIPNPGSPPSAIGAGSAVQWGQNSIAGWSVDLDSAAVDFPFDMGVVVDFEYNTTGGQTGVDWYHTFQQRIAERASTLPPPPTPPSTPPVVPVAARVVSVVHPNGGGPGDYWLVGADGGVFSFGQAAFYGSTGNIKLAAPIVTALSTSTGKGYWLVGADGGVFSFGDAEFYGAMGGKPLAQPITAAAPTSTGKGYWLVGADGGVFSFGDAAYSGRVEWGG